MTTSSVCNYACVNAYWIACKTKLSQFTEDMLFIDNQVLINLDLLLLLICYS